MSSSASDTLIDAIINSCSKINRARRHIHEAEMLFKRYAESDFYTIVDDRDPQSGHQLFRVVTKPLPSAIALSIGDAFHCMSTAFDYLATGAMRAAGGSAARVTFPSHDTRAALRKSFMAPRAGRADPPNRRIVKTLPGFVCLLLSTIRPYQGGSFLVWEIRKADNVDKHNLIMPTVAVNQIRGVVFTDHKANNVTRFDVHLNAGAFYSLLRNGGMRLEIEDKGQASVEITFPEDAEVFASQPVLSTLLQCHQAAGEVIQIIAAFFGLGVKMTKEEQV